MKGTFLTSVMNFFILLGGYFIELNKIGFEVIKSSILGYPDNELPRTVWNIAIGVITIVGILMVDFFIIYGFYLLIHQVLIIIRTKEIKRYPVIGNVKSKRYVHEHMMYQYTRRTIESIYSTERYNIQVKYEDKIKTFNNKDAFDRYRKNDDIPLILVEMVDKNEKVLDKRLELPE